MLRQIFHLNVIERTEATMQGDISKVNALNLHPFHHLPTDMKTSSGGGYSSFIRGEDGLEIFHVVRIGMRNLTSVEDITRQRCLTERKKFALELLMRTVVEKTKRTTTARRVIDDLSNHGSTFIKEQLVTNAYLTCRLYQHVPQAHFTIELA